MTMSVFPQAYFGGEIRVEWKLYINNFLKKLSIETKKEEHK